MKKVMKTILLAVLIVVGTMALFGSLDVDFKTNENGVPFNINVSPRQ